MAPALIRRLLAIFDRIADFEHGKLAGGDIRQLGRFGWFAPPTGGQEFAELAGVGQGARSRRPTDLDELAQNQLLIGSQNLESPGDSSGNLSQAPAAREVRFETQQPAIESLQRRIDRRIGLVAEKGRSAAQMLDQPNLPIQQPTGHGHARLY